MYRLVPHTRAVCPPSSHVEAAPVLGRVALAAAIALLSVAPLHAQTLFQGRIDVTIHDAQGGVIPGAAVDIAGPISQQQVSDVLGEAHFLNLPPGTYTVTANLQGFRPYSNDRVLVAAGSSVPLRITLAVSGVAETISVQAEAPAIDPSRQTLTTSVSYQEMQQIPSSRDPWVVLQTIPGVVVDRVNVGGAESGQQSNFLAKGASGQQLESRRHSDH